MCYGVNCPLTYWRWCKFKDTCITGVLGYVRVNLYYIVLTLSCYFLFYSPNKSLHPTTRKHCYFHAGQLKNICADCKICTEQLVLTRNISHKVNTQILRVYSMHTKCCKYLRRFLNLAQNL